MILKIPNAKDDEVVYIDDTDFELVKDKTWGILRQKRDGYILKYVAHKYYENKDWSTSKIIYLHRLLLSPPKELLVDHINGDGLDNRRSNLRVVTHSQNQLNRHNGKNKNKTTYA